MGRSGGDGYAREHVARDYEGILEAGDAKRRVKRRAKARKMPVSPGRAKGTFSLRSMLRERLQVLRGNRPKSLLLVDAVIDAAIRGDRDFNMAPAKLIIDHLEGTPHQTIVADVSNRDGYADLPTEELLRIAGLSPLDAGKKNATRKARKPKKGDDVGS